MASSAVDRDAVDNLNRGVFLVRGGIYNCQRNRGAPRGYALTPSNC
jgi:hypothetical protein